MRSPSQSLVDIAPLAFELPDALGYPLEPDPVLRRPGRVGLVQAQLLADGLDRKPQPP